MIEGDSVLIADENPRTVLKVIKRIMQDLYEAPDNPALRGAGVSSYRDGPSRKAYRSLRAEGHF